MYILVDTYVHILRTRWECTSTTSPSWWTPPPTGQSVFFHDALLLFILFKNALPLSAFTLFENRLLTNVLFTLSLILPALLLSKKLNMINERLNLAGHNPSPSSLFPTYSLAVNHVFPVQPASNPLLFLPLDSAISAVFLSHCSLFRYFWRVLCFCVFILGICYQRENKARVPP